MSSSNSRKKNSRFYWAELGFVGLGLLGLNPNLIGDLLGGNSSAAQQIRQAAQTAAADAAKVAKDILTQHATSGHTAQAISHQSPTIYTYPNGVTVPAGYGAAGYGQVMPQAILYSNQLYYPQVAPYGAYPTHQYQQPSPYQSPHQSTAGHQGSMGDVSAYLASLITDAARKVAFDQGASQQQTSLYSDGGQGSSFAQNQNPQTVPPANYPPNIGQNLNQSYGNQVQRPTTSGLSRNTSMVEGYDSNYPSVLNRPNQSVLSSNSTQQYNEPRTAYNGSSQYNSAPNTSYNNTAYGQTTSQSQAYDNWATNQNQYGAQTSRADQQTDLSTRSMQNFNGGNAGYSANSNPNVRGMNQYSPSGQSTRTQQPQQQGVPVQNYNPMYR